MYLLRGPYAKTAGLLQKQMQINKDNRGRLIWKEK